MIVTLPEVGGIKDPSCCATMTSARPVGRKMCRAGWPALGGTDGEISSDDSVASARVMLRILAEGLAETRQYEKRQNE